MSYSNNPTARAVRRSVASPATAAGTTAIYLTVPGWPAFANLDALVVTANNPFTSLTATVLTDGAAHKAALANAQGQYVQALATTPASAATGARLDMGGGYVEDGTRAGSLHVLLTGGSAFTTGTVFTVSADGRKALPTSLDAADHNNVRRSLMFRGLLDNGGALVDLTTRLTQRDDPYSTLGFPFQVFAKTTDALYLGSDDKLTKYAVSVDPATLQAAGQQFTFEYWNGTAWSALTVLDNTSDRQTAASSFSYSGSISFAAPSDWAPQQLAADPLKAVVDGVHAGTQPPMSLRNPDRYWIRVRPSAGWTGALNLLSVVPLR